jgi:hypothetical protein
LLLSGNRSTMATNSKVMCPPCLQENLFNKRLNLIRPTNRPLWEENGSLDPSLLSPNPYSSCPRSRSASELVLQRVPHGHHPWFCSTGE